MATYRPEGSSECGCMGVSAHMCVGSRARVCAVCACARVCARVCVVCACMNMCTRVCCVHGCLSVCVLCVRVLCVHNRLQNGQWLIYREVCLYCRNLRGNITGNNDVSGSHVSFQPGFRMQSHSLLITLSSHDPTARYCRLCRQLLSPWDTKPHRLRNAGRSQASVNPDLGRKSESEEENSNGVPFC